MFLADAAGRISKEFMVSIPTCVIDSITTVARRTTNMFSTTAFLMPLLADKDGFILVRSSLLNKKYQTNICCDKDNCKYFYIRRRYGKDIPDKV